MLLCKNEEIWILLQRRWYDRETKAGDAIELLKDLDSEARTIISNDIVNIANSIKTIRKEQEIIPLSIGINRVLGLYQTNNSRRWYDREESLDSAFKTISTLPEEDFKNIMEGICTSLKN